MFDGKGKVYVFSENVESSTVLIMLVSSLSQARKLSYQLHTSTNWFSQIHVSYLTLIFIAHRKNKFCVHLYIRTLASRPCLRKSYIGGRDRCKDTGGEHLI